MRASCTGLAPRSATIFATKSRQPFLVLKDLLRPLALVLERDADTFVDVADDLEPFANRRADRIRPSEKSWDRDGNRPWFPSPRGANLLQRASRLAAPERHLPQRAVALDLRTQLG